MDEQTRSLIEYHIDDCLKEQILPEVEWASKKLSIASSRDYALGYLIAVMKVGGVAIAASRSKPADKLEDAVEEVEAIIEQRIPEMMAKLNNELGV